MREYLRFIYSSILLLGIVFCFSGAVYVQASDSLTTPMALNIQSTIVHNGVLVDGVHDVIAATFVRF